MTHPNLYEAGYSTGRTWAKRHATQEELRRIERSFEELCQNVIECQDIDQIMNFFDVGSEFDPQPGREHRENIVGFRTDSDVHEPDFILGFVEGVLEEIETAEVVPDDPDPVITAESNDVDRDIALKDDKIGKYYRSIDLRTKEEHH